MRRGFRVILIVIALFTAAVIAILGPRAYVSSQRSKTLVTRKLLAQPKLAIDEYARRHGTYPVAHSFAALQKILGRADPWRDAWGNELRYEGAGSHYLLWSPGRNGRADGEPLLLRAFLDEQVARPFDLDLVVQDGIWAQYPWGTVDLCETPPIKRVSASDAASTGLLIIDLAPGRYAGTECPRFEILSGGHRVAVTQAGDQQVRLSPGRYGVQVLSGTIERDAEVIAGRITFITVP